MRNLDFREVREAIKESSEIRKKTAILEVWKSSPGVVFEDKLVPRIAKESQFRKFILSRNKSGND